MTLHQSTFYVILFCLLTSHLLGQAGRCGTDETMRVLLEKHPELKAEFEEYLLLAQEISQRPSTKSLTLKRVPVVFHIVHEAGEEEGQGKNISDAQIAMVLDQVNIDFRHRNPDSVNTPAMFQPFMADLGIEFERARRDPSGAPTTGITRFCAKYPFDNVSIGQIQQETSWDTRKYLNVWVLDIPDPVTYGYSYLPNSITVGAYYDGVILDYQRAIFDNGVNGRTLTHELGHWLGLLHTWGFSFNNGCTSSDGISDTPLATAAQFGCPSHPSVQCGGPTMFMNYMDYPDDGCRNLFTIGQRNVARSVLDGDLLFNGQQYLSRASIEEHIGFTLDPNVPRPTQRSASKCATSELDIVVYSNPAIKGQSVDFEVITFTQKKEISVTLFNALGQVVQEMKVKDKTRYSFDIGDAFSGTAGVYFLKVQADKQSKVVPVMMVGQ